MNNQPLILIDAYSQIFRAYYAIRHLSNSKGEPTNAIFVFARLLLKLEITAPEKFTPGEKAKILLRDENGNFPPIEAECEILKKIPAYPVLGGPISGGEFTGN